MIICIFFLTSNYIYGKMKLMWSILMNYEFDPERNKKDYEDEKYLKKKYDVAIAMGMMMFLNALDAAENAYDIKSMVFFYMEHKKGNLDKYYAVSLDKKKSKWRLLLQMIDDKGNVLSPTDNEKEFLKSVKIIRIKELTDHYAHY